MTRLFFLEKGIVISVQIFVIPIIKPYICPQFKKKPLMNKLYIISLFVLVLSSCGEYYSAEEYRKVQHDYNLLEEELNVANEKIMVLEGRLKHLRDSLNIGDSNAVDWEEHLYETEKEVKDKSDESGITTNLSNFRF